jgi:hypothetical protein
MKLFFLLLAVLSFNLAVCQMVVSDPGVTSAVGVTNTQLGTIQSQIASDNQQLLEELRNLNSVLQDKKEIQEEIRDRQKREEEALYIVPDYIKNGSNINNILDSEVNILRLIQQLRNVAQTGNLNSFIQPIMNILGKEVDSAIKICSDNNYRMTADERLNYLREIDANMLRLEQRLKDKINQEVSLQSAKVNDDRLNESYKKLLDKKITPIRD